MKGTTYALHKLQCIQGDCFACGISTLQVCPYETNLNNVTTIPWQQLQKVLVGRSNDGKDGNALYF
jgi:hypothetical protein